MEAARRMSGGGDDGVGMGSVARIGSWAVTTGSGPPGVMGVALTSASLPLVVVPGRWGRGSAGVGVVEVGRRVRLDLAERRVVHLAECDVHRLLVGVEVDRAVPALVPEAGGLDAAERGAQVADVVAV